MLKKLWTYVFLNVTLIIGMSSSVFASSDKTQLDELLGKGISLKKNIFFCPDPLEREEVLAILKAPIKKVASPSGGNIPDSVGEPVEIRPGLWAAHKMPDTTRLLDLMNHDVKGLIEVLSKADESRPDGTMGKEYDSIIGTYLFYQKKRVEDKAGTGDLISGYSLVVTLYRKKT